MKRTRQRDGKSSGDAALNIMLLLGGTVVILGLVIVFQKSPSTLLSAGQQAQDAVDNAPATPGRTYTDEELEKLGFRPNRTSPNGENPGTSPTAPATTGRFVGDPEWKQYHRPDCKRTVFIDPSRKKLFATPEEAFAAGYIPCKVCRPGVPAARVSAPVSPVDTKNPPTKNPVNPPPKKTTDIISLPIKDVQVPFEFKVASRDVVNERGSIRVEYEVDVQKPLMKGDVLLLAQKIVAQETAKGPVNAVTMTIRLDPKTPSMLKWICVVDWAPWGILSRAGEIRTGDYKNHSFNIYDQGFFNPKR